MTRFLIVLHRDPFEQNPLPAYLRKLRSQIADTFWLLPTVMTILGVLLAVGLISLDRSGILPPALLDNAWVYNGGGSGARTLLGAIASSTIGVAGTVFSITIAALSLAAGQMGPRLLRNFTHDRGNQITLGALLATFSDAMMVLRSVRTHDEGIFVLQRCWMRRIFAASRAFTTQGPRQARTLGSDPVEVFAEIARSSLK